MGTQQMAAKFFALVALLAVGARASPVFDHSNMANADNTDMQQIEAEFLERVLNKEVEENIAAFDMLRRSNTSNATGTGGNTGGGGATPVAVPAVDNSLTGTTQRTQQITLSGITSAQFPTVKTAVEIGYCTYIGLYLNGAYVNGASCVASTSRRALAVTMTTTVPNSHLAAVTAHQTNLANDAGGALSALTQAITTAMSNQNITGVTITVSGAQAASTPSPTPSPATTSGASQTAILSVSAIAALVLALRH